MENTNLVKDAVLCELKIHPETRDSDFVLIKNVIGYYVDTDIYSFSTVCEMGENGTIPAFETIRRWRQKFQEMYPELQASNRIKKFRKEKEEEIRELMKKGEC